MDFISGKTVWNFYNSIGGVISGQFIWLLLACAIAYHMLKRKELFVLCVILLINQIFNHSVSGYLLNYPKIWNVAWVVSDLILVYAVFRKVKYFNNASFQDISVVILSTIAIFINLIRYIERFIGYQGYEPLFTIRPIYGVSVQSINLVILLVLITPVIKISYQKLKDFIDGFVIAWDRRAGSSRSDSNS